MWLSNTLLRAFEQLKHAGFPLKLEEGAVIARGYADAGAEQFLVLPNNSLLSLFTGKTTPFPEGHERFFFSVLSCDQLVGELSRRGVSLAQALYENQRSWYVIAHASDGTVLQVRAETLQAALLEILLESLKCSEQ